MAMAARPTRYSGERNCTATLLPPAAHGQVGQQRRVERLARVEQCVIDAGERQFAAIRGGQRLELGEVPLADHVRGRQDLVTGLEIPEPDRALEGKRTLRVIEHMEHEHVAAAEAEVLE